MKSKNRKRLDSEIISGPLANHQAERQLLERETLQQLLMKLATNFINVPLEKVDAAINEMLEVVGKFTQVDRAYIFNHDYTRQITNNTHEWCADGISPEIDNLQAVPLHLLADNLEAQQREGIFHIPNVAEMPEKHNMRLHFEQQGIQSLIVLPLRDEKTNTGFVGLDAVREPRHFSETEINLLKVLAELITNVVEHCKSEEALRESEEKHRRLFETMAQGVIYQAADGSIISANPAAERILGLTFEQMQGKTSMDPCWKPIREDGSVVPGTEHPAMVALRTGKPVGPFVMGIFPPQINDHVWLSINAIPLFQPGETIPFQAYATFDDITDKRKADEALQESEGKYRKIVENINDGLFIYDFLGNIIELNENGCLMLGYTREELLGANLSKIIRDEDNHYLAERLKQYTKEDSLVFEAKLLKKDTSIVPVEVSTKVVTQDGAGIIQGLARDITDRKQAEKQIAEKNKILSLLNKTALEQAAVGNYESLIELILEQLNGSTNAIVAVFNEYDANKRVLITRKVKSDEKIIDMAIRMGGKKILNTVTPVNDAVHHRIMSSVVNYHATLTQASEGTVSATVSAAIQKLSGIDRFIALSHVTEGQMYGTSLIGLGKGQVVPSLEFLESFAHVSAISLRRLQAEQQLDDYTLELEQLYHQLDKEIDKARQVHERTLPLELPVVEGLSFAAHYQPAQKMGGDFYDIMHKDNKLIFYLSDVSGHGLDGALLSTFIKHTIRSYISITSADTVKPANMLHYLARQFGQENYPEELYFCIYMAVLDLKSMQLTYSSAGFQETPLVRMGNGERLKLYSKGLFVTSYFPVEMLEFHDESLIIIPGTTIFFNTDGLTEQGSKGRYYRDRLPKIFYKNAHRPPQLVAKAILDDFRCFNNGSLQGKDDITFLLVQADPVL